MNGERQEKKSTNVSNHLKILLRIKFAIWSATDINGEENSTICIDCVFILCNYCTADTDIDTGTS